VESQKERGLVYGGARGHRRSRRLGFSEVGGKAVLKVNSSNHKGGDFIQRNFSEYLEGQKENLRVLERSSRGAHRGGRTKKDWGSTSQAWRGNLFLKISQ